MPGGCGRTCSPLHPTIPTTVNTGSISKPCILLRQDPLHSLTSHNSMYIFTSLLASVFAVANAANSRRQAPNYSTTPSGTTQAPATSSPPTVSFSLYSTNPTAVPLSNIVQSPATEATVPLTTTYAAGAAQTLIPGAPNLPSCECHLAPCRARGTINAYLIQLPH
jgi:hypothetical protein